MIKRITIIGAGNVATLLSKAFVNKGFSIEQIFSRTKNNAEILANKISKNQSIKTTDNLKEINDSSNLYIVCVKDDAIATVIQQLPFRDQLIVHTSGSVGLSVFEGFDTFGVLYPLQTFSKNTEMDIHGVPFCVESNSEVATKYIMELATTLSGKAYEINTEQRKVVHLAAVFACNFSNYMYSVAEEITSNNNIDFDILKPLIIETAKKIITISPKEAQTGPAKRKDQKTIAMHLAMLENNSNKALYQLITKLIQK